MTQQLRAMDALAEDPDLAHSTQAGGSQLSVTLVPGDLMSSSGLLRHNTHMWYPYRHAGKSHTHTNI